MPRVRRGKPMANPRQLPQTVLNGRPDKYPMTGDRLYDYEYNLRNSEKLLKEDQKVRAEDKRLIFSFMSHIKAQQVSIGRQAKYINLLRRCAQLIRVPFRKAKRRDMEDLVTKITDYEVQSKKRNGTVTSTRHYSPETLSDFRMALKRFQKFVRYGDTDKETPFPDEVRWIKTTIKISDRQEKEYFNDKEAEAMIRAAVCVRDKALLSLWAEAGGRPSEILLLKVGDVEFDDRGVKLHIRRGKTGSRTLRIISSVSFLTMYLETHSFKDDPNAPLWLSTSMNHLDQPWSWDGMNRMVKATAKRAGIKKNKIHGYMFRHGSATRNAKFLTDSELKKMYGWSMSSRMPAVYIHLNGDDLDAKYQQVYGPGRSVEPPKPTFAPPICPRCHEKGSPGMRFCPKCASPLDEAERAKMALQFEKEKDEKAKLEQAYNLILNTPGLLEKLKEHSASP